MTYEFVPKHKLQMYGSINSVAIALATLAGPLFGGLINNNTTWRWIFYLNIPAGVIVMVILLLSVPNGFPFQHIPHEQRKNSAGLRGLMRIDLIGLIFLLAGSLMLSAVLLEYSLRKGWRNAGSIVLIIFAVLSWVAFFSWEWYISTSGAKVEALFPWEFIQDRPWMGILLSTFLCGVPFNVLVIFVPQRLQIVSGVGALGAGERLLPYTFSSAFGAALAMMLGSKKRLPVYQVLIIGSLLQTIGISLLTTLPTTQEWPDKAYGFTVISGLGLGMSFGMGLLSAPFVIPPKNLGRYFFLSYIELPAEHDTAVAGGSIIQFRFLGGIIGLAIVSNVFNSRLKDRLESILTHEQILALDHDTSVLRALSQTDFARTIHVFATEYNYVNKILIAFAAAQLLAAAMVYNKKWSKLG
jgi:MFS family permease